MKKIITSILILSSCYAINAQKATLGTDVSNIIEKDCNGGTRKVSDITATGKAIMVIASGYDCSICRGEAPDFGIYATANQDKIAFWGAMHNRFSSNTPTCNALSQWRSDYDWNDIYMFNDVNQTAIKFWAQAYTYYTVVDPSTNKVAYFGSSQTDAKAKAQQVTKITSIDDNQTKALSYFTQINNQIQFAQEVISIQVLDITGKVNATQQGNNTLNISDAGFYLLNLETNQGLFQSKIIIE